MPYNTSHNFGDTFKPDPNASLILPLWGMLIMHDTVKMPDMPGLSKILNFKCIFFK